MLVDLSLATTSLCSHAGPHDLTVKAGGVTGPVVVLVAGECGISKTLRRGRKEKGLQELVPISWEGGFNENK